MSGHRAQPAESLWERIRASWRSPRTFTALVPLPGAEHGSVHAALAGTAAETRAACAGLGGLHSLRVAVLRPEAGTRPETTVLLNTVFDEPLGEHLDALARALGERLGPTLCGSDEPAALLATLRGHRVRNQTYYIGNARLTVRDVLEGERLRRAVQRYVDDRLREGPWEATAESIRLEVREHVLSRGAENGLPAGPLPELSPTGRLSRALDLLGTFLGFPLIGVLARDTSLAIRRIESAWGRLGAGLAWALWWVYGAIPTALGLLCVRLTEACERDQVGPAPDPRRVARLEELEDVRPKNAVTLAFAVKRTWTRRVLLRLILFGSERGTRHLWTAGALAGIETIHYARLAIVDGGRTMLFMSDYDGALNPYLDDFLGVGSRAVVPISSNMAGCPPTRWLFRQADPDRFRGRWRSLIRLEQEEEAVWYSAYPLLSTTQIRSNAALRRGLFAEHLEEKEALAWCRSL